MNRNDCTFCVAPLCTEIVSAVAWSAVLNWIWGTGAKRSGLTPQPRPWLVTNYDEFLLALTRRDSILLFIWRKIQFFEDVIPQPVAHVVATHERSYMKQCTFAIRQNLGLQEKKLSSVLKLTKNMQVSCLFPQFDIGRYTMTRKIL